MAVDATNVAAGSPLVTGGVYAGPLGTALPTSTDATLNVALVGLGYASEDGVVPSGDEASTTDIKAWGGTVVASVTDSAAVKRYTFTLIEPFSSVVNQFVFGTGNVVVTAAASGQGTKFAIADKGTEPGPYVIVFDMKYGDKRIRDVIPNGKVKILSERPFVDSDVMGWECEVTCLADSSGVYRYRYTEDDDPGA